MSYVNLLPFCAKILILVSLKDKQPYWILSQNLIEDDLER